MAAAIASASGQDLDNASLSRSVVRRKRLEHRYETESSIRQEFHATEKPLFDRPLGRKNAEGHYKFVDHSHRLKD